MTLIESLVEIFKEEATKVFKKEAENVNYLRQNWLGTTWRAFKGLMVIYKNAFQRQLKMLTFAIARHRFTKHGDDSQETVMNKAVRSMSVEDKATAKAQNDWWLA